MIRRLGTDLLQEKKMAVLGNGIKKKVTASHLAGRDLLSSLGADFLLIPSNPSSIITHLSVVRANMAADLSPQHKLSDPEVMARTCLGRSDDQ